MPRSSIRRSPEKTGKVRRRGVSKREVLRLLKQEIRDIELEIGRMRAKQQGLEKAMSILLGEGP